MAIEFLKGDTLLARAKPDLPAAGPDGRLPYVVTVPIDSFAPGEYSVRGLVMHGGGVAESETAFTIDP
jgi:hypothetical protein